MGLRGQSPSHFVPGNSVTQSHQQERRSFVGLGKPPGVAICRGSLAFLENPHSMGPPQIAAQSSSIIKKLKKKICVTAAPEAYGSFQVRGQIRAAAASLHHSHSNMGSELHLSPKIWNASQICLSSLHRGHANFLCIVLILMYVLPKQAL